MGAPSAVANTRIPKSFISPPLAHSVVCFTSQSNLASRGGKWQKRAMKTVLSLWILSFGACSSAALSAAPAGAWKLSSRACSTDAPFEDPFFGQFVRELTWAFLPEGKLEERLTMFDPEKNFTCL